MLITLTSFAPAARAMDGNEIYPQCIAAQNWFEGKALSISEFWAGHCTGLMTGVIHSIGLLSEEAAGAEWRACLPEDNFTPEKGVNLFVEFLKNNPDMLELPAAVLATRAVIAAYPCD